MSKQRCLDVIYQDALRRRKTGRTPRNLVRITSPIYTTLNSLYGSDKNGTRTNFIRARTIPIYNVDYLSTLIATELGRGVLAATLFSFIHSDVVFFYTNNYLIRTSSHIFLKLFVYS